MTIVRDRAKEPFNVGRVVKAEPFENTRKAMSRYIRKYGIPDYWLVPPRLEGFAGLIDGRLLYAPVRVASPQGVRP